MNIMVGAQNPKPFYLLDQEESGTSKVYIARDYVRILPGFSFRATSANSFVARIDGSLVFTPVVNSNPAPGETAPTLSGDWQPVSGNTIGGGTVSASPTGLLMTTRSAVATNRELERVRTTDTLYISPIVWLKTVPVNDNLNGHYHWKDFGGKDVRVHKYNASDTWSGAEFCVSRDKIRTYNFNPAIDLSDGNISKELSIKHSGLPQSTIVGVWGVKEESMKAEQLLMAINGRKGNGVLWTNSTVKHSNGQDSVFSTTSLFNRNLIFVQNTLDKSEEAYHEQSLRIGSYSRTTPVNSSVWGESAATLSMGGAFNANSVHNSSTFPQTWNHLPGFNGYTPELMIFDRVLSPKERMVYESYLALKYGLSLDTSYVAADGKIIWDITNNTIFNHRITGYGRQDALSWYQKMSTTSYEEAPYFSDRAISDSYDLNNSYRLASRNRLLVVGKQPFSYISNNKYIMYGDNGGSLWCTDSIHLANNKLMARKWQVRTNEQPVVRSEQYLQWTKVGLSLDTVSLFKSNLLKPASSSVASAITTTSLMGDDGSLSWTVGRQLASVLVKFGAQSTLLPENSAEYGYQFAEDGNVYAIRQGRIDPVGVLSYRTGDRIELEKNGALINIRLNGVRYRQSEILITEKSHLNARYYGCIAISNNPYEFTMSNLRHGGFVDTGNRIELSYCDFRAKSLMNYRNGEVNLYIDRTGSGEFSGQVDKIVSDEVDEERSKIIFNNVFWDTDRSGSDVFTFGYNHFSIRNTMFRLQREMIAMSTDRKTIIEAYGSIHQVVTVKVQLQQPASSSILIYDLSGNIVYQQQLPRSNELQVAEIALPVGGIYIVKVVSPEKTVTKKIMVRE